MKWKILHSCNTVTLYIVISLFSYNNWIWHIHWMNPEVEKVFLIDKNRFCFLLTFFNSTWPYTLQKLKWVLCWIFGAQFYICSLNLVGIIRVMTTAILFLLRWFLIFWPQNAVSKIGGLNSSPKTLTYICDSPANRVKSPSLTVKQCSNEYSKIFSSKHWIF